jgi:molybdopterin-guanine dinucleotide biosynthesis protein MobB
VKHSSHGFLADRPGKDSYRLYESGAQAVALVSAEQRATFTRLPCRDSEPSLAEALTSLPDGLDLVLAEGFSWEPIPRLVVVPGSDAPLRKHFEHGEVLRVVRVPKPAPGEQPAIARQLIESIALELVGLAHERRRTLECTPSTSVAPAWLRS